MSEHSGLHPIPPPPPSPASPSVPISEPRRAGEQVRASCRELQPGTEAGFPFMALRAAPGPWSSLWLSCPPAPPPRASVLPLPSPHVAAAARASGSCPGLQTQLALPLSGPSLRAALWGLSRAASAETLRVTDPGSGEAGRGAGCTLPLCWGALTAVGSSRCPVHGSHEPCLTRAQRHSPCGL